MRYDVFIMARQEVRTVRGVPPHVSVTPIPVCTVSARTAEEALEKARGEYKTRVLLAVQESGDQYAW